MAVVASRKIYSIMLSFFGSSQSFLYCFFIITAHGKMMQADMLRCGSCKVVSLPCLRTCALLLGCSLSLLYTLGRVGSVARAKLDERIAELLPEVERLRKADRKRMAHPKTSWYQEKHLSLASIGFKTWPGASSSKQSFGEAASGVA